MESAEGSDCESGIQPLTENSMLTSAGTRVTSKAVLQQLFNIKRLNTPNSLSTRIVGTLISVFCKNFMFSYVFSLTLFSI